ncbi:MAG: O-antigen ligase domain-containing protein [Planctomycetes bacterium]|nr:O-antigen ligase domain-containing protein [Planctomycetota bacterium]
MNTLVPIALYGWIPFAAVLFACMPARRAAIYGTIAGWLFLPVATLPLPGLPDYDKTYAIDMGVFLGALLFDTRALTSVRVRWYDLPMLAWVLSPAISSLLNGLGPYDAGAQSVRVIIQWGLPWWIGRAYLRDLQALKELATAIVVGGLAYAPLCLWEIRMSPQLHGTVYGFHQHDFSQTVRWGGFRPTVFMHHGLMVGMWMASATLVAAVGWLACGWRRLGPLPMGGVTAVLLVTTVLCKSVGAILLLLIGVVVLLALARARSRALLAVLVTAPIVYLGVRASGAWSGRDLVQIAGAISTERADSLAYRLGSEDLLAARARQAPWFGWGGFGRSFVTRDEEGYEAVIVDSLWVLVFGQQGVFGLVALLAVLLVPVYRLTRTLPSRRWFQGGAGAAAILAVLLLLFLVDDLANFMYHPVYMLAAGGLAGLRLPRAVPSVEPARAPHPIEVAA